MDLPGGWDSSATLVDGRWVDRRRTLTGVIYFGDAHIGDAAIDLA